MTLSKSLLLLAGMMAASVSHAAYYNATGTINVVATTAPDLWGEFDYLLLNGLTSAGACAVDPNSGYVLVILPTPKSYATALSAQAGDRQVQISLDDTRLNASGNCILRWIKVL